MSQLKTHLTILTPLKNGIILIYVKTVIYINVIKT